MERELKAYFKGEKQQSLLFMGIGLLALIIAAYGWLFNASSFWKGLAVPLFAIALIQLIVGGTIFLKTEKQLARLLNLWETDPQAFVAEESARMAKVNQGFQIYRSIELILLLVGLFFFFMGAFNDWGGFLCGAGLGLSTQGAIMLVLDLFAEWRGGLYAHWVGRGA